MQTSMPSEFLSCDWGTSSFRLRRVLEGKVIAEIRDSIGIRTLFEKAASLGVDRPDFASRNLKEKLNELGGGGAPLIISGMASSSIGWKELPYAKAPFALDGGGLRVEQIGWDGHPRTFLVSGVATDNDVMRGEETQIIGVMNSPRVRAAGFSDRCALVLPGTHSKHVHIAKASVSGFRTYMTGELFDVLGRHSILQASVTMDKGPMDIGAFRVGVTHAIGEGLAASLFSVRAQAVLHGKSRDEGSAYLSGILIGAELNDLTRRNDAPIVIAAAGNLKDLYAAAMSICFSDSHSHLLLSESEFEQATIAAHGLILTKLL